MKHRGMMFLWTEFQSEYAQTLASIVPSPLTWLQTVANNGYVMSPFGKTPDIRSLSPAQAQIMEIVWQCGEVSARDVRLALNESDESRDQSRSTVRTLMDRMEEKGWLKHRLDGRTFLYSATQPKKERLTQKLREVVETLCDGRPEAIVATLLDDRGITQEGLQSIRKMLDEAEQRLAPNARKPKEQSTRASKNPKTRKEAQQRAKRSKRKPRGT